LELNEVKNKASNCLRSFYGFSERNLSLKFGVFSSSKNRYRMLSSKIIGEENDAFLKENKVLIKTIRINKNNRIKESMSFSVFNFVTLAKEKWESSDLRDFFIHNEFLFIVFKEGESGYSLINSFFWKMPIETIDSSVKHIWQVTHDILVSGNVVKEAKTLSSGKRVLISNFPGMAENGVCHVRPHAADSSDSLELPVPDVLTGLTDYPKQCFWLNNTYILKIVGENNE
jgi:DNA mismatch repair protein MutH